MHALFSKYPRLLHKIPLFSIGAFPTPADKLQNLCTTLNRDLLYIKRDDISAVPYGGNKVRKLELLIGDALSKGARRVITSGAAGSNHALATAIYAGKAGLKTTLMLFTQPNSLAVRNNLLMDLYCGAELFHDDNFELHRRHVADIIKHYEYKEGKAPYVIPSGGSSPLGITGYVNAAFELRSQIDDRRIPEPSSIHVAFGTMGTAAGLLLGMKASGIKSRLIMVRVVPVTVADMNRFDALYNEGNRLLHGLDQSFPLLPFTSGEWELRDQYLGGGYGLYDGRIREAVELAEKTEEIHLDPTYSGKAFASFIDEARENNNGALLFWNTKNSRPYPLEALSLDYHRLPKEFYRYFEEEAPQPASVPE